MIQTRRDNGRLHWHQDEPCYVLNILSRGSEGTRKWIRKPRELTHKDTELTWLLFFNQCRLTIFASGCGKIWRTTFEANHSERVTTGSHISIERFLRRKTHEKNLSGYSMRPSWFHDSWSHQWSICCTPMMGVERNGRRAWEGFKALWWLNTRAYEWQYQHGSGTRCKEKE